MEGIEALGQVEAGGPIYPKSNIMLSYLRIFTLAKEKLYVTNPYFIPSESIMDALKQAAISGVDVRLMVPETSDSAIVGAASRFYFKHLLDSGVRIFLYKKRLRSCQKRGCRFQAKCGRNGKYGYQKF